MVWENNCDWQINKKKYIIKSIKFYFAMISFYFKYKDVVWYLYGHIYYYTTSLIIKLHFSDLYKLSIQYQTHIYIIIIINIFHITQI